MATGTRTERSGRSVLQCSSLTHRLRLVLRGLTHTRVCRSGCRRRPGIVDGATGSDEPAGARTGRAPAGTDGLRRGADQNGAVVSGRLVDGGLGRGEQQGVEVGLARQRGAWRERQLAQEVERLVEPVALSRAMCPPATAVMSRRAISSTVAMNFAGSVSRTHGLTIWAKNVKLSRHKLVGRRRRTR